MGKRLLVLAALALVFVPNAAARGGSYGFDGGTRAEQAQVTAALDASSFDWGVVPGTVTIHIARSSSPHAVAGQIWLDADLLDAGRFSWGVVQHEYAHQVDFLVLTDAMRARLHAVLHGSSWWGGPHAALDCERFADALAWAYWQSADNVMRPESATDEGGQVDPASFQTLVAELLPSPVRTTASRTVRPSHPNG